VERGVRRKQLKGTLPMKCRDLMQPVCSCPASANVMRVAAIMRDTNCGAAAIVAADGKPIGLTTDRDLTTQIAAAGKDSYYVPATELAQKATSCMADEDAREAAKRIVYAVGRPLLVMEQDKTFQPEATFEPARKLRIFSPASLIAFSRSAGG
jgi:CBS domain-containing protein